MGDESGADLTSRRKRSVASDANPCMANLHDVDDLELVRDVGSHRPIDQRAAQRAAADLLLALGADLG